MLKLPHTKFTTMFHTALLKLKCLSCTLSSFFVLTLIKKEML